jgi:hypothetical protein
VDRNISFVGLVLMFLTCDAVVWLGGLTMVITAIALTTKVNVLFGVIGLAVAFMASSSLAVEVDRRRPRHRHLLFVGPQLSPYRYRAMLVALVLVAIVFVASAAFALDL